MLYSIQGDVVMKNINNIKKRIEAIFYDNNIAGMSVAVTDRQGVVLSENYGVINSEVENYKTLEGSLYRIASVSKIIAGLTILKLADEKLLCLDTPIKEYIPNLKMSLKETEEKVTLRQLLSHTSGLPAEYEPDGFRDESSLKRVIEKELPNIQLIGALSEKKYCYSNWGIRLASYVAQEITGELFSKLAMKLIIRPIGMNMTMFDPLVALTYPVSLPHICENGCYSVIHQINENAARYAAGGLFSNTEDLSKLARFFINNGKNDNGKQVLSEKMLAEMISEQIKCSKEYYAYGLTMMFFERNNMKVIGHLGSHPPYSSSLIIEKNSGYGVATLMNTYSEEARIDLPFEILGELINSI